MTPQEITPKTGQDPQDEMRRYPSESDEQLFASRWRADSGVSPMTHMVRQACDWQRERDALICEAEANYPGTNTNERSAAEGCAYAIRKGDTP